MRSTLMPCGTAFMNSEVAPATSLPSSRMLAPLAVTTPMPMAGLPSWRTTKLRGDTKPRRDRRDIAQTEHAAIAFDRRLRHRLDAVECAGDAERHALRRCFNRTCWNDIILFCERIEQRLRRDAERGEFGMREFDEDFFILGAVD